MGHALPLLLLAALSAAPRPDDPLGGLYRKGNEPWQLALREVEPLARWKQINWVPVERAVALATAQGKPILLSIYTGASGRPNAPFT